MRRVSRLLAVLMLSGALICSPSPEPAHSAHSPVPVEAQFPSWTFSMKVWPFDILYPGTTLQRIRENLDRARNRGANTVIFYIEEEQMYRTFVDETGFSAILQKIAYLVAQAHSRGLRVICYLNGLEVMAHNACNKPATPTLYRSHPGWVQTDIKGKPMVWRCIENGWITPDMEDAWASPYSGFRDLFKDRLVRLAANGLDAVYIDQASLPGMQDKGNRWASRDPGFAAAFETRYGLSVPTAVDWSSVAWRKFIYFRHEAIRDYLSDLADTARTNGMAAFFESSSNDTADGTLLGNDPALTVAGGIAYSPEIEPEGVFPDAFRMAKFAKDARQGQPILFLGWPATASAARKEFAVTLCHSGNYYPTSEAIHAPYPSGAFKFLDALRVPILNRRVPYQEIGLIYSTRNKDWTFTTGTAFDRYADAFRMLSERHLPFRIIPLETMRAGDLAGVGPLVLAGIESISDAEFSRLSAHQVVLLGANGTRDRWYVARSTPLKFPKVMPLSSLEAGMPFTVQAPTNVMIEYYRDRIDTGRFFLFIFSPAKTGQVLLSSGSQMSVEAHELDRVPYTKTGSSISAPIRDFLLVLDVRLQP